MNDNENINTVLKFYETVIQGQISIALKFLSENVEWQFFGPKQIPFCGKYNGRQQVKKFFLKYEELVKIELFEIEEIISKENKVIVLGFEKMLSKYNHDRYKTNWVHIYTFNKGEIVKFYEYSDTATISLVLSSSEESLNN